MTVRCGGIIRGSFVRICAHTEEAGDGGARTHGHVGRRDRPGQLGGRTIFLRSSRAGLGRLSVAWRDPVTNADMVGIYMWAPVNGQCTGG